MVNKAMKTLTKEEILDKICKENMSNVHNMKPTKEMVLQAMQSYSDQENARLTAINDKQAKLINRFLKGNLQIPMRDYSAYQKLKDDIFSLQSGKEPTAVEIVREAFEPIQRREEEPKHPTSWRDFTMTEKIENEVENCIHFDLCQGRNYCLSSQIVSTICIGVDCGHYEDKK